MSARTFTLMLLDGRCIDRIAEVTSLVAEDASGQFGIEAGHEALITVLEPGLFRYRIATGDAWTYAACVGGLLSCARADDGGSDVRIVSSRFIRNASPEALQSSLDDLLARESNLRMSTRESQLRLDLALYKKMQQLAQTAS